MAGPDRQFDPVANAALGAVRASDRGLRQLQNSTPAPELPNQSQATRQFRDGIKSASSFSPANVLAGSGGFDLPGMDSVSVGGVGSQSLPDPAGVFGGEVSLSDLAPQNILSTLSGGGLPEPPMPGNGGGGGGGGGGGSGGSSGGAGDANAPAPTRGAGASR
jgi:hypothetical protein